MTERRPVRLSEVFEELLEGFAVLQHIWQRQKSLRRKALVSPNTSQAVRKKRARAWLTSLTLLIMLFRRCSSFSLFCWLVWWMICCERKQHLHPDIAEGAPRGRDTLHTLSTYVSFRSFQQFNSGLLRLLQIGLQSFHLRKDEFVFYLFG